MLDVRNAQTTLENLLRDSIWQALGRRLPSVTTIAALRAVVTQGASASTLRREGELINLVNNLGAVVTAFKWSPLSGATDDGATVIKPTDVTGIGRWLAWTTPLRIALIGGLSDYLHNLTSGPLANITVLDKDVDKDEMTNFLSGAVPAVAIDARGDEPEDLTQNTGDRWTVRYNFTVYIVAKNLRGHREAAQGSHVTGESVYGANDIDGLIWALLGGTQLYQVVDGIRNVQMGHGVNWTSDLARNRVIRSRDVAIIATVENPAASNDAGAITELDIQFQETDLHDQTTADASNYVVIGIIVGTGSGLTQSISAGSAVIAGATVAYAGQSYTFSPEADTYRDLNPDGTLTFQTVSVGGDAPPLAAGALRIGVTTTNATDVTDDRYVATTKNDYGPVIVTTL